VHGRSLGLSPLFFPGGGAPSAGQGTLLFTVLGGFGLGLGVLVTGRGVGAGVMTGVGTGVTRGVGAAVGAVVGTAVPTGDPLAAGRNEVTGVNGEADGLASIDGEGLAAGLELGTGPIDGELPGGDVGAGVPGAVVGATEASGVGGAMIATGPEDAADRVCNWTPPMPSAIVARTRFRTPRLKMRRTR
jgi:hypothetical protein